MQLKNARPALLYLLLVVLCGSLPAQARPRQAALAPRLSANDLAALHTALDAYDGGNTAQAEPALRTLTARYPKNYEASEALGSIYAEAGDLVHALPYLEQAVRNAPHEPLAHANLGVTYVKLNRTAEAVRELRLAVALDPRNPGTQASLGRALAASGQPAAAARAFASASALKPGDPDLTYDYALALDQSGSPKEAAAALDLLPASAYTDQTHMLAADIDERLGRFQPALIHFQAAAQLSPTDPNLYALTAELLRHWNWEEAIKIADFASARYPRSEHFKLASGIAFYGKSDYPPAVSIFSSLLAAHPDDATTADLLGRSCAALQDGENAGCAAVYDYAQRHPGNAVMTTYAAVAILHAPQEKQNLDLAATLLHSAIAADPKYSEAWLRLGVLEQMRLHWAESATALEQAVALNPTAAEAHYRLSRAYAHLGRRDEAQQQIALHQTYSDQAKRALDGRLQEVVRFILNPS